MSRLSRDAHFLLGLQKSDVQFVAVDILYADSFTVRVLALVAQKERETISQRMNGHIKGGEGAAELECPVRVPCAPWRCGGLLWRAASLW